MSEIIMETNVLPEKGYLHYITPKGDVGRFKSHHSETKEVFLETGIKKEAGFLYFFNSKGQIGRAPLKKKGGNKKE